MRFSIVIPVYNVLDYLTDCVGSVLSQSYTDYEIVLVNDGSTDGSANLCKCYKQALGDRMTFVSQENKGLLLARRAGFRASNGDIIVSLDGDDMLRSDALSIIDRTFNHYNVDIVLFGASRRADYSSMTSDRPFNQDCYIPNDRKAELLQVACMTSSVNSMCFKAISRRVLDFENDYTEYAGLSFGEDLLQTLELLDRAESFYYIDEPLYYYRVNYASLTKTFNPNQIKDREVVGMLRMKYARKWAQEYGDESLIPGVEAMGLRSYALMVQSAAERLNVRDSMELMRSISEKPGFIDSCRNEAYLNALRVDFRIILFLLRNQKFHAVVLFCRIKGFARRKLTKR